VSGKDEIPVALWITLQKQGKGPDHAQMVLFGGETATGKNEFFGKPEPPTPEILFRSRRSGAVRKMLVIDDVVSFEDLFFREAQREQILGLRGAAHQGG